MEEGSGRRYGGEEDPLAYGDFHASPEDPAEIPPDVRDYDGAGTGERGIVGDAYRKLRSSKPSSGLGSFIFHKLHDAVNDIGSKLDPGTGSDAGLAAHNHSQPVVHNYDQHLVHRYGSFADQRIGNDAKWFVDGCGYMWAVSRAIEQATTSIWILDCKLFGWISCWYR